MRTLVAAVLVSCFTLAHTSFPLSLLGSSDLLVSGTFSNSVLLQLPPCQLAGNAVNLNYMKVATNVSTTLSNIFTVPPCRTKRDLIVATTNSGHYSSTNYIGYQVNGLSDGTQYRFQYVVGNVASNPLVATTRTEIPYTAIDAGLQARSGAMVVITVILAVTALLLIVGLVVTLALAHCRK